MTLALLCQFTAQHVSDVNTSIFRSLRLLVALLCRLTWGVLVLCNGIVCWWCGIRVQAEPQHQQTIPLHNTNTPQVSLHNNATGSRKLLKRDVLTSETCWAVNWHNKASVIKLVYLYSKTKVFPSYLMLCNIFSWNSIVKYPGIITELSFFFFYQMLKNHELRPSENSLLVYYMT